MHMFGNYKFKKKEGGRGGEEREKQQERISTYHIFGKQKGLLQSRGYVTPNTPIEVLD